MTSIAEQVLNRKCAALLAVGFCGYLTVATSENMPQTCPPESTALERSFTSGAEFRSWKLAAVSAIEITSWHIQVSPAVTLTYVPPPGGDVRVIFDPSVDALGDAGVLTGADDSSAPFDASGSPPSELPPNHVLVGAGSLTVVCNGDPSLCDDVRFEVALSESDAKTFTLEAIALRSNCASSGEITDLRLEPVDP